LLVLELLCILYSAIFTIAIKKHGLPTLLKTNLMPGNAKQRLISQGD